MKKTVRQHINRYVVATLMLLCMIYGISRACNSEYISVCARCCRTRNVLDTKIKLPVALIALVIDYAHVPSNMLSQQSPSFRFKVQLNTSTGPHPQKGWSSGDTL